MSQEEVIFPALFPTGTSASNRTQILHGQPH